MWISISDDKAGVRGGYGPGPEKVLVHEEGVQYSLVARYGQRADDMRNKSRHNGWQVEFDGTNTRFYRIKQARHELPREQAFAYSWQPSGVGQGDWKDRESARF